MAKSKMKLAVISFPAAAVAAATEVVLRATTVFPEPAVILGYQLDVMWDKDCVESEGHVTFYEGGVSEIARRGIKRWHQRIHTVVEGGQWIFFDHSSGPVWFPQDCRPEIKEDGVVSGEFQVHNEDAAPRTFQAAIYLWYYEK